MDKEQIRLFVVIITVVGISLVFALLFLAFIFQKRKTSLIRTREKVSQEISKAQVETREQTLRNISWELHDNIGQLITLAKIQVQNQKDSSSNKDVYTTLKQALEQLRLLSKMINPDTLKRMSLIEAITTEIDRFNRLNFIKAQVNVKEKPQPIGKQAEIVLFRIVQECLSNAIKHSKGHNLNVDIIQHKKFLEIIITDDGIGFSTDENFDGIGLYNISERAKLIGANVEINSKPQKGTRINIKHYLKEL